MIDQTKFKHKNQLLAFHLAYESGLVSDESMLVLEEFERFAEPIDENLRIILDHDL